MITKKRHDIEEALGIIWSSCERREHGQEQARQAIEGGVSEKIFEELLANGFVRIDGDQLVLTPEGEATGRDVTRRHRLAERLLADVIDITGHEMDTVACEFEHIISADVTDAICTLLGHPRVCPHGLAIPEGACCRRAEQNIEAIVVPLDKLNVGEKARVAYIVTLEHPHLHKLLSLGIVPGREIHLHQKSPSYVIKAGQTQIALDGDMAKQIYVRRK
jgi:DtxR family Mn-dependent transcriptional regulator